MTLIYNLIYFEYASFSITNLSDSFDKKLPDIETFEVVTLQQPIIIILCGAFEVELDNYYPASMSNTEFLAGVIHCR